MQKKGKKREGRKKRLLMVLAGFLALLMFLPVFCNVMISAQAANASISSLKKEAQSLAEQKKELSGKIKSLSNNKTKTVEQKQVMDQQNIVIQGEIKTISQLIAQYDSQISQKETELKEAKEKETVQYQLFCERVRSMEENGSVSYLSVVFGAKDFSDLLDRFTMVQEIMRYDKNVMKELAATRQEIADAKTTLETSQAEKKEAKAELVSRKAELSQQIQSAQSLVVQMESDTAAYQASYAELDAQDDAIAAKIDQLVA
ncbi:MAG: peptidase M23, partial [Oscillospiraceae bacterium]|nr:peptidase M23 [Oscillospiraceae bacterium]